MSAAHAPVTHAELLPTVQSAMAAGAVRARPDLFGPRAREYGDWLEANAVSLQQFTAPEFADGLRQCTHPGLNPTVGHACRMLALCRQLGDEDVRV